MLHLRDSKIFFHPAKFDNFKDEKISDFKTVFCFTKQKLPGLSNWWSSGIMSNFLVEFFFVFWGSFFFFKLNRDVKLELSLF